MALRLALVVVALSTGGCMLVDGSRNLATGTYLAGGRLGPRSLLVSAAGRRWGWPAGIGVGVCSHWYLAVGAALALAWLVLLAWRRSDPRSPAEPTPLP